MKLILENWRNYLKENREDYAETVETAELEMVQELLDASETFRAAWKEMEQSVEGTSHHFGETTAEHTRNVLKELDEIIESMDEKIDTVRQRKLRLAAALHDIAKPPTRTVDDSGRVRFFGHPKGGVEMAKKILEEIGETDTAIIVKIVEMHMDILQKADELRKGLLKKEERAINRFLNKIGDDLEDLYLVAQANINSIIRPEGAKVVPGRDWEKFKSDMEEHIDYQRQWMEKARAAYKKRNIDEPDLEERKLKPGEKRKLKRLEKEVPKKDFTDRYGKEGKSIYYATLTKMAKKKK